MKRTICFILSLVIVFLVMPQCLVSAEEENEELSVSAPSAVLMEYSTGTVLFEKEAHTLRPCASITKVMTLCLTFEAIESGRLSLDDTLSASAHAASMGGSDIWLKEGESMTVDDLIKATVIMSANDAAVVLAENIAGSEEAFVSRMNEKAKALGMEDTTFKNCNGLDEEGHLTSAYDVALMSRELMRHEKIFDYTLTWIDYVRDGATQLVNTNKLIRSYQGITGLKTGTTSLAGSCISATAERDSLSLIAVVLGAPSTDDRFKDAAAMLDYGFAGWAITVPDTPSIAPAQVIGGMEESVRVKADGSVSILTGSSEKNELEQSAELNSEIKAPVKKGDVLGRVVYSVNGEEKASVNIVAEEDVEAVTFLSALKYIAGSFFSF